MRDDIRNDDPLKEMRRSVLWGVLIAGTLAIAIGVWACVTSISGAVIASGTVGVISDVKRVQPSTNGVVKQIRVIDGQKVTMGQPLIILDDTVSRANMALTEKALTELHARQGRLLAERDQRPSIVFQSLPFENIPPELVTTIQRNETRLFELRRTAREGRKAQLREQISQIEREIEGNREQVASNISQRKFISQELDAARTLWESNLIPLARVSSLEREAARLEGEKGRLQANIAQLSGRSAELRLATLQLDKDLVSEVALEFREVSAKILQEEERYVAARDQINKMMIVAPASGVVHQLQIKTIGAYVEPGEVLMLIVPTDDELVVEARVSPVDIDQVKLGADVRLVLTAFNQRLTPELLGKIAFVAADTQTDPRTGAVFYSARVSVPQRELEKTGDFSLVPGMPVDVFIRTGDRRVISIVAKPLLDQLDRAFRQE